MDRLLSREEVEIMVKATKAMMSIKPWESPEFVETWKKEMDMKSECEKVLNILENLLARIEAAQNASVVG